MKTCSSCNLEQPIENFRYCRKLIKTTNEYSYYRRSKCITCDRIETRNRRSNINYLRQERISAKLNRKIFPERALWRGCKERARIKNMSFTIEISDICIPERCPLLDIPLYMGEGKAGDNSPSVDRIDTTLGYVKGNIRVISRMANIMKAHATKEQLLLFSKNIINYLKNESD